METLPVVPTLSQSALVLLCIKSNSATFHFNRGVMKTLLSLWRIRRANGENAYLRTYVCISRNAEMCLFKWLNEGIRCVHPSVREYIYFLYGFCKRICAVGLNGGFYALNLVLFHAPNGNVNDWFNSSTIALRVFVNTIPMERVLYML